MKKKPFRLTFSHAGHTILNLILSEQILDIQVENAPSVRLPSVRFTSTACDWLTANREMRGEGVVVNRRPSGTWCSPYLRYCCLLALRWTERERWCSPCSQQNGLGKSLQGERLLFLVTGSCRKVLGERLLSAERPLLLSAERPLLNEWLQLKGYRHPVNG